MDTKNTISLYCNWNIFIDQNGDVWLPSVHAQYIKALKNIGFNDISLSSKVNKTKSEEHDYVFSKDEIDIVPIIFFTSYLNSFFRLPSIIKSFYQLAKKNTDFCYIRTYEPFIWILVLMQKLYSSKTKLCMHYISDPKSAIFSNANSSVLKKILRYLTFLPEYYLTNIASIFCNVSSNGPVPIKNTPFFVKNRIIEVIESALLESDVFPTEKNTIQKNVQDIKTKIISILYVGYIRPSKGINILVEAVNLLVKDNIKNFKVTIIGNGEYLDNVQSIIKKNNLTDFFEFKGYVPFSNHLFDYYRNSDIFINLSPSETGPRVLLEAGVFGCQLISTKVGYSKEILQNDGILIDINNSQQAKEALQESISIATQKQRKTSHLNTKLSHYTTEYFFKKVLRLP